MFHFTYLLNVLSSFWVGGKSPVSPTEIEDESEESKEKEEKEEDKDDKGEMYTPAKSVHEIDVEEDGEGGEEEEPENDAVLDGATGPEDLASQILKNPAPEENQNIDNVQTMPMFVDEVAAVESQWRLCGSPEVEVEPQENQQEIEAKAAEAEKVKKEKRKTEKPEEKEAKAEPRVEKVKKEKRKTEKPEEKEAKADVEKVKKEKRKNVEEVKKESQKSTRKEQDEQVKGENVEEKEKKKEAKDDGSHQAKLRDMAAAVWTKRQHDAAAGGQHSAKATSIVEKLDSDEEKDKTQAFKDPYHHTDPSHLWYLLTFSPLVCMKRNGWWSILLSSFED